MRRKQNRKQIALISILAVSALLGGCSAAPANNAGTEPEKKAAVPVEVAAVTHGVVEESASLTGKFYPNKEVKVAPKINGKIASINIALGQRVSQGETLFTLDSTDLRTSLKQAEASYQSALANLNQTQVNIEQSLAQAENGLKQAQQAYDTQKKELERTKELYNSSFATEQQLEQAKSALQNAELALENARIALSTARKKSGLEVAKASVQQSKLSVETARENLANATVTAPLSGIVSATNGSVGEFASPQAPVVTIIETKTLLVKVNVSEEEISTVKKGEAVEVTVPSLGKTLQANVRSVSPVMDPQAKAYPIEIAVPNPNDEFKVDMIAEVRFLDQAATKNKALVVPRNSVIDEDGKKYVYKVEGNKAVKQEITVGKESSELSEVTGGLAEGDKVVSKGMALLSDGDEIAVQ